MTFAPLFPNADFRHHFTVKRGDLARFFASSAEHAEILAERNRWLDAQPELYAGALDSAEQIVHEAATALVSDAENGAGQHHPALAHMMLLGRRLEPDIVLLEKNSDGMFRVVAGCVCFPSSWSFPEKLGKPLDFIHTVVPDLNNAIGAPISRFLDKLQPAAVWERSNWGLSSSPARNQHPTRETPCLASPVELSRVWLRVEDQVLAILPETKALLFGIRIVTRPLQQLREEEPAAAAGLQRALQTMPEEMARYKNIAPVRMKIAELLD